MMIESILKFFNVSKVTQNHWGSNWSTMASFLRQLEKPSCIRQVIIDLGHQFQFRSEILEFSPHFMPMIISMQRSNKIIPNILVLFSMTLNRVYVFVFKCFEGRMNHQNTQCYLYQVFHSIHSIHTDRNDPSTVHGHPLHYDGLG